MRYKLGTICESAYTWYHEKNLGSIKDNNDFVGFELDSEDSTIAYLTITNDQDPDINCFYRFKNGFLVEIIDPLYPESEV
jgi:hypothetical protein